MKREIAGWIVPVTGGVGDGGTQVIGDGGGGCASPGTGGLRRQVRAYEDTWNPLVSLSEGWDD